MQQGHIVKATVYIGPDGISSRIKDVGLWPEKVSAVEISKEWEGKVITAMIPPKKKRRKRKIRKSRKDNQSWLRGEE